MKVEDLKERLEGLHQDFMDILVKRDHTNLGPILKLIKDIEPKIKKKKNKELLKRVQGSLMNDKKLTEEQASRLWDEIMERLQVEASNEFFEATEQEFSECLESRVERG
jgi:hypothetical protein